MLERDTTYFRIFCTIFWIVACYGFVADDITFFQNLRSPIMMIVEFLFLFLGFACIKRNTERWIVISFFAVAFISTVLVNHCSIFTYVNGCRTYFGLLVSIPIFHYFATCKRAAEFKESLEHQLYIFLILQAICITIQFLRFGACDAGGGSFGWGCSGDISLLIIAISFYFLTRKWDTERMMVSLKRDWKYVLLLYPIFLNETKVSLVMLVVYIALLFEPNIKTVRKLFLGLPILAIAAIGAYYAYDTATSASTQDMDVTNGDFIAEYLTGGDADELDRIIEWAQDIADGTLDEEIMGGMSDVPRFAKISFIPLILPQAPGGWLLGAGVGMFKGGTNLGVIPFQKKFVWTFSGTIMVLLMLIYSLGLFGVGWYFWVILYAARLRTKPTAYMGWQVRLLLLSELIMILVYNDALRQLDFSVIIFMLLALVNYDWKAEPETTKTVISQTR